MASSIPPPRGTVHGRRALLASLGALGIGSLLPGCGSTRATPARNADWPGAFGGVVVERGAPAYEQWRRAMPWQPWVAERRPACIVRPRDRTDLAAALAHARNAKLRVAIKSGGHNVAESFLRDDGMLIDLDGFRAIAVDADGVHAWVEPAAWSRDIALALAEKGLAFPVAHCATVPMGGYLLGGGIGINTDQWGVGCHAVDAAEILLADGRTVIASARENTDLFWAVRGAGTGFFGIVTRYRLRCRPLPRAISETIYAFPFAEAPAVGEWLAGLARGGLPHTEAMMLLAHNARAPAHATAMERKLCIARLVHFDDDAGASEATLAGLRAGPQLARALMHMEMQPTTIDRMMIGSVNAAAGLGFGRSGVDTIWTDRLGEAIEAVSALFTQAPSPLSHFVISPRHGLALPDDACFSRIGRAFMGCYAVWHEAAGDTANFDWLERTGTAMAPFAGGRYINELDGFRHPERVAEAFSPAAHARLEALRARHDPGGLFQAFPGGA